MVLVVLASCFALNGCGHGKCGMCACCNNSVSNCVCDANCSCMGEKGCAYLSENSLDPIQGNHDGEGRNDQKGEAKHIARP
jgi:hypothetical protein